MAKIVPGTKQPRVRGKTNGGIAASMSLSNRIDLADWVERHGRAKARAELDDFRDAEDMMIANAHSEGASQLTFLYRLKRQSFTRVALAEKRAKPISSDGVCDKNSDDRFYLGVADVIRWR